MLSTNTITSNPGSRKKTKRVGRGNGSGKGTFSTRWMNGQNCRSWGGVPDWFEGWQTPLFRRMPKLKGFSNARFTTKYTIINLSDIEFAVWKWVKEISRETLLEAGVITRKHLPVKLLGRGELKSKINITIDAASTSAKEAVKTAGGTLTLLSENTSTWTSSAKKEKEISEDTWKTEKTS